MKNAYATTSYFLNIAFNEIAVNIIPAKMPSISVTKNLKSVFLANSVNSPLNSNLNDLIRALNSIGVAPVDLISILQALKKSGSLQAELIII